MDKAYSKYKETSVSWLREIPEKWEAKRLKFILKDKLTYGANEVAESEDITLPRYIRITDFGDDGVLRNDTFKSLSVENAEDYLLSEGDILFARSGATVGKTFQFKNYTGVACFAGYLIRASVNEKKVLSDFLYYYTKSKIYESWKDSIFAQATIQNIGADKYANLFVPIPSIEEQEFIVNFLNKKTSEIETLISNKEKLIELLKEERSAIINNAVTKGINPKAKMTESGIEWLGEIPEDWEVKRLKYLALINPNENIKIDLDEIVTFLPMENVSENGDVNDELKKSYFEVSKGYTTFKNEDIIVAKITPCFENGKGALIKFTDTLFGCGSTEFHVIRTTKNILNEFIYYVIRSHNFMNNGEASMTGAAGQKRVPTSFLENYLIAYPQNLTEQKELVSFLNKETKRIDKTISTIEKEIELIKEYRTALISEAVTGKIDLRNEKKPL